MESILILLIALAIAFMYLTRQNTAAVPIEHDLPVPEGDLEAVEYFWRPG